MADERWINKAPGNKKKREEEEQAAKPEPAQAPQPAPDQPAPEPVPQPTPSPAPAAEAPKPEPAAPQATVSPTSGQKRGPVSREGHIKIGQAHALRETKYEVKETSPLDKLPENREGQREEIEQKNKDAGYMGATLNDWSTSGKQIEVDTSTIADEIQLAYFVSTLKDDASKAAVIAEWAQNKGVKAQNAAAAVEQVLGVYGGKAFDEGQSIYSAELWGYDNQPVNLNYASPAEAARAVKADPNKDRREKNAELLIAESKRPGSRFYGMVFDEDELKKYNDTAALPKALYDEFVETTEAVFDPTPGHEAQNEEEYQRLMDSVENGDYTDYQKHYLRMEVEMAYASQLGYTHAKGEAEADAQAAQESGGEIFAPEPLTDETRYSGNVVGGSGGGSYDAPDSIQTGADRYAGMGPVQAMIEGTSEEIAPIEETQTPAAGSVNLASDPIAAVTDYVWTNRGNELDEQTRSAVNEIAQSSTAAKVVMGLDYTGSEEMYEQAQDDPFALARANSARFDYIAGNRSTVIGGTLGGYLTQIEDDSFPAAIRNSARGAVMQIGMDAEAAYMRGEFTYDTARGNMYDAYIAQNPMARDTLRGVFRTVDEIRREERRQAQLSADVMAKAEAEKLAYSRAAMQTESYTQADYDRVLANSPTVTTQNARTDATYNRIMQDIRTDRNLSSGSIDGWYNEKTADYLMAAGLGGDLNTVAAENYKDMLLEWVEAEALNDVRIARSLGYDDVEAYYARQGGFDMGNLYDRAAVSIQRFGESLTKDDIDAMESLYRGSGETSGLDAFGAGVMQGGTNVAGEALEAIWMMGAAANEDRPSAVANVRNSYIQKYGAAIASYAYTQDMLKWADSGYLPNAEMGQYIKDYIASGEDVFQMGLMPDTSGIVLQGAVKADRAVEALSEWAYANLNENQGKVFEVTSSNTSSLGMQAMSSALTRATGSGFVGSMATFGMIGVYPQEMREQLADGRSLKQANALAATHAATTALSEMNTSNAFTDKMMGALGVTSAINNGAALAGKVGTTKTFAGMAKAFGKGSLKGLSEMAVGELVTDEFKGQASWNIVGSGMEAAMDGATVMEAIGTGLANADTGEVVQNIIGGIPESFVYMSPTIFLGGFGEGFSMSRRYAAELAATGSPDAAKKFGKALGAEIQGPKQKAEINQKFDEIAKGERAAAILMTDSEIRPTVVSAAEAKEQADSHAAELEASEARKESAQAHYKERKEAGDIPGAVRSAHEIAKAQQGINEHTRERDQKQEESSRLFGEAANAAMQRASAEVNAQKRAFRENAAREIERKTDEAEKRNIAALDAEMYIDDRYADSSEEMKREIRENPEWRNIPDTNADESRAVRNAIEIASRLSKRFDVPIQFDEGIEGGAQGAYEDGVIHIDKGTATQSEVIRRVMVHELTHRAESSKWYGELRDALVEIGYGSDAERFAADKAAKMNAYNDHAAATGSGKTYSEAEIEQEIVADLAGNLFTADEAAIERLVQEKPNLMQRIYEAVRDFVRKLRGVNDPELDRIRNAERLMRKALDTASDDSSGTRFSIKTTGDGTRYVLVDTDQDIFDGHEPREYPAIAREYIKNRFRHTIIGEGENRAFVDARTGGEYTNPANRRMDAETFEGKMRASTELDNLIKASKYVENSGPVARHPEFPGGFDLQDVVFQVSDRLFEGRLNIGIDDKGRRRLYDLTKIKSLDSGSWVKQHGGAAAQTSGLSSTDSIAERRKFDNRKYSLPSAETLNQEISAYRARENRPAVQTGMTEQAGAQRQEAAPAMGERQFATKTAQESGAMPEWLKQELMSDPQQRYYERDSNNAQLMRAWERYRQEGYDGVRDRILAAEHFTADDIADANMIMAMAFRNEDVATALQVAQKYNTEGTKEGQTLQARSIFKRMTPTGIRTWAAGQAEARLADYIQTHTRTKRDVDATASDIAEKIRDMQAGDEILRLNAAGSFRIDSSNNKWGVPINEQQKALIDQYGLGKIERPGLFYNRATRKQRMLEAILATPNPLEVTGNGLNLIQRLEYMQAGQAVITNADLNYIGHQLAQYAAMDADAQQEREGDLALSRAYEAYGNIQPASMEEKARTWRYTSMLLSIPSAGRNIIGNAAQNAVNATAHGIAVELDKLASLVTGQRTMEHLSAAERAQGWNAFADETVNTFKDFYVDKTVTATMRGDDRFDSNRRGRVYETGFLEAARLAEGYLMSVGDRNFWKKAYVNSIAEQQRVAARNGETLDMSEAAEIARAEANYATFNEDSSVRDLFTRLKQNDNVLIRSIADFLMPFTGVPTNITKRMIEYSPAGLISTVINRAFDAARGRDFDQKRFITELSRGLTGTALFGIGMLLKEAGLIMLGTSDEDDSKVYGVRTAQGAQYSPYIRVGDEYVSLAAFAPSVSPLIMGATAIDIFREDGSRLDALYNACLAGFDQIFDASYMSAIQDIFTGYGSAAENIGQTVLNSAISQNVPAVLGQLATSLDPYVRDTKDKDMLMQALKSGLIQKIPGVREMLPEKVDVAGRSVISKEGLRNFFDPFTTTNAADDPVLDEMMRIYEATGESSFMPVDALSGTKNTLTVNKEKIIVDGKDKETYRKRYGEIWYEGVERLMARPSFARMSDEKKMEEIAKIVKSAKDKAAKEIAKEIKQRGSDAR